MCIGIEFLLLIILPRDEGLPMRLQYGLDDDSDGAIAVNLLPLMVTARQQTSRLLSSQKPRYAFWYFNLEPLVSNFSR